MSEDDARRQRRKAPAGMDHESLQRELRRVRSKAGWDPAKFAREQPLETLMRLEQEDRNAAVYEDEAEAACPACLAERASTGDDTALCAEHLASAMGF